MMREPVATFVKALTSFWLAQRFLIVAFLLLALYGGGQIVWGEKIPANDGLGMDGQLYGQMAQDLPGALKTMPSYTSQRFLPSAAVYLGMKLFGVPPEVRYVIKGFEIYNLLLLLLTLLLWALVASGLQISERGKWLGFCFMFLNFAILKNYFYYPVLTDMSAFALGTALLWFYVRGQTLAVFLVALVGQFVWPTFFYSAALLYIFPRQPMHYKSKRSILLIAAQIRSSSVNSCHG